MNTQLSINQETDRIAKGWDIFSHNLVEQINEHEYLVKDTYIVTMFSKDDILSTCTCMDWKHRINMIDTNNTFRCKHQIAVEFLLMDI